MWSGNLFQSTLYERQKSSSSIWYTCASWNIHRIVSEFWRMLDRRLDHRGLARHGEQRRVQGPRQKIHVQRSWNQEIAGSIRISWRRWFLGTRRSRTTSNPTPPGSREIGREESTLCGRGDPLQSARSDSLQVELFSGADRDAVEAREDLSGQFVNHSQKS